MVPYALDGHARLFFLFLFAFASIFLAPFVKKFLGPYDALLAPSAMTLFILFYQAFDKFTWRWGPHYVSGVPDLNGDWIGTVSANSGKSVTNCKVRITQNWTHLSVRLETDGSKSDALVAALKTQNPRFVQLMFAYEVRRTKGDPRRGDGFNRWELNTDASHWTLEGPYFSDALYGDGKHTGIVSIRKA